MSDCEKNTSSLKRIPKWLRNIEKQQNLMTTRNNNVDGKNACKNNLNLRNGNVVKMEIVGAILVRKCKNRKRRRKWYIF